MFVLSHAVINNLNITIYKSHYQVVGGDCGAFTRIIVQVGGAIPHLLPWVINHLSIINSKVGKWFFNNNNNIDQGH